MKHLKEFYHVIWFEKNVTGRGQDEAFLATPLLF